MEICPRRCGCSCSFELPEGGPRQSGNYLTRSHLHFTGVPRVQTLVGRFALGAGSVALSQTFVFGGQTVVLGGQTRGCVHEPAQGALSAGTVGYATRLHPLDRDPVRPLWHRDEMALPAVIEPCLPSPGEQPPTGPDWVHEIKHDGYRLMARRDALSVGIRLLTRDGHDWASRYPLIVQAVRRLKVRSCLIDGEAVCCNERGVASFDKLRHRSDPEVFLVAFDLLELRQ